MSNPAVITLAYTRTSLGKFQVEDNLGEAIHLHLSEIRCDLSISEFEDLADAVGMALERFIKCEGFSINKFSSEFLFQLAEINALSELSSLEEDTINLREIQVDTFNFLGFPTLKSLSQSRVIKALNGRPSENNKRNERNYYGQTNQQRLDNMLDSIKKNGYPYKGKKIVLLKGSNKIYDGQHRAACMYHLWGNKEVPILRITFLDNKLVKRNATKDAYYYYRRQAMSFIKKIYRKIKKTPIAIKIKLYSWVLQFDRYRFKNFK